ncbi:GGDEF domain-containing protein [Mycolicibacterium brisbanense]|uniref:Diguanylate cyclase n=1 Tax=Mycolicibacterium brisbanense TaxID=146020 RepID=A0A100VXX0_9MYCO|nr:GGDEF domain-containing protein [Mycolicibacterium brisbanense]GAS88036.1 diguanylate cyclase [Mycolicibacterium brisbanense]
MARGVNGVPQQLHQFDWLSTYIEDRGLRRRWQWATALYTAVLATLPLLMLWSPNGPDHALSRTIAAGIAALGFLSAMVWLVHWPTRGQSSLFLLAASALTGIGCATLSNPYSALVGCVIFAVLGGFIAYFHTLRYVIGNFVVCAACATIFAVRLIKDTGDIALTVATTVMVAALNIGVPFGIRSLVHTLRSDLTVSDHDPLTGLHTRRAFYRSVQGLVRQRAAGAHLVVLVIDLDNFKLLNDTWGHARGDRALARVGAALRENCPAASVIGRLGGEEFVVADIHRTPRPNELAERICRAIAAIPFPTTASVGSASAALDAADPSRASQFLDDVIDAADLAMYAAKNAGGNQVCHYVDLQPAVAGEADGS